MALRLRKPDKSRAMAQHFQQTRLSGLGKSLKSNPRLADAHLNFSRFFTCLEGYECIQSCLTPADCFGLSLSPVGMEVTMSCQLCRSSNEAELNTEMVIHFSGLKNLDKPGVWVFSRLLVCLDCGSSQLKIPERELAAIAENTRGYFRCEI